MTRSPLKPARSVDVRLSQATTLAALQALDPRLSQETTFRSRLRPSSLWNSDPSARARIAAVQSRVAALVVSGPRAPAPTPAFSPFHDGSYWCTKCPRRWFRSVQELVRHTTHCHEGSAVDDTCALFVAIARVTCATPSCGGL